MNVLISIALQYLIARRRQSFVSLLGVALGVGFFVAVSSLMQGSQKDFVSTLVDSAPHITISDEYREARVQPANERFSNGAVVVRGVRPREEVRGVRNFREIVDAVSVIEGAIAMPTLSGSVVFRYGGREVGASLLGVDPLLEPKISNIEEDMVEGGLDRLLTAGQAVVLGRGLMDQLGLSYGDTVSVASAGGLVRQFKIVGVYQAGGFSDYTAYVLLRRAQVLLDRPNKANQVRIKLEDSDAARSVASALEARFDYKAESWQEANEDFFTLLIVRNVIMYSVVSAILIVASFGIFNIISTVVMEKSRDIAILKSMGFRERDIRTIFVIQGVVVGLIGAVTGWVVAGGLLFALSSVKIEVADFGVERLPLDMGAYQFIMAGVFASLSAVFASYLPARKAAKLRPVDIIRGAA